MTQRIIFLIISILTADLSATARQALAGEELTGDQILDTIRNNYSSFEDMQCKAVLDMSLGGNFGNSSEYMIMKMKRPGMERTETYASADYQTRLQTSISSRGQIQLIERDGEKTMIDLAAEAGLNAAQINAMNVFFNLDEFKASHVISLVAGSYDEERKKAVLTLTPHEANSVYDRIDMTVNFAKGIIEQWDLFKNGEILQTMKILDASLIQNAVWMPTAMEQITPMPGDDPAVARMTFSDIRMNMGLDPAEFEFQE